MAALRTRGMKLDLRSIVRYERDLQPDDGRASDTGSAYTFAHRGSSWREACALDHDARRRGKLKRHWSEVAVYAGLNWSLEEPALKPSYWAGRAPDIESALRLCDRPRRVQTHHRSQKEAHALHPQVQRFADACKVGLTYPSRPHR